MVNADGGLPDPDNPDELRVHNEGVILVTDDESDQETVGDEYSRYQPLSSIPPEDSEDTSDEEPNNQSATPPNSAPASSSLPQITPIEDTLVKEVWSAPPPKSCDIEMDSKKVDEVKQAMMNITLPPGSIPDWAASIPEEEWKQQLFKRLENIQEKKC